MAQPVPPPRPLLVAYLAVVALHLGALGAGLDLLALATKPLLMGLLLAWAVVATRPRVCGPMVAGLALALLGDVLLDRSGTLLFLAGMLAFLGMQVCYIWGFVDLGALERLRRRSWVAVGYGVLWLVLNIALGPLLGSMRWPMFVYSFALAAMAAAAAGSGSRWIAVGGAVFLLSDLLIGVQQAGADLPASGVLVMSTYSLAQYLIVTGWVLSLRSWVDVRDPAQVSVRHRRH